jgi:hypothetical protein
VLSTITFWPVAGNVPPDQFALFPQSEFIFPVQFCAIAGAAHISNRLKNSKRRMFMGKNNEANLNFGEYRQKIPF